MKRAEQGLVDYLKEYCYGREHALRKDSLAAVLGMSTRKLREIKRNIVVKYGMPIGSYEGGYFYAKEAREIEIFKNYYLSLIREHLETIKAYEEMISRTGQLKIDIGVQDENK